METNNVQITLKGASFRDCIAQAKELVVEAEKFGGTVTTTAATTTARTRKGKTAAPAVEAEESLDMTASDDGETLGDTDTTEETDLSFDSAETDEAPAATTKTTKAAKITDKDINAAAMAHAKKHGRPKTLEILAKKFKVKSILELKADQYADVLKALKV